MNHHSVFTRRSWQQGVITEIGCVYMYAEFSLKRQSGAWRHAWYGFRPLSATLPAGAGVQRMCRLGRPALPAASVCDPAACFVERLGANEVEK